VGRHVSAALHRLFGIPTYKDSERLRGERMLAPPVGSQPLPGWACWYPEDRVPLRTSIKSRQRLPPPGWGQLWGCHVSPRLWLPARGSCGAVTCPRGSGSRLPARGSSGDATCRLGSSTHHLAHGSSGSTMCPEDRFCRPQANKQISPGDQAIMISIRACTHVSSKTLCDKVCSACSQGMQQVAH
jgi:hypothetical protein